MCIIAVSEAEFSGGKELAIGLASRLGLRYLDAGILVARATARGGNQKALEEALETAPSFLDRFTRHRHTQILLLQAALAEEIREGNAVCFGAAADLLNLDAGHILRIHVEAPHRFRRMELGERLGLNGDEAERYLRRSDRDQRRWRLYLFGTKTASPHPRDITFNMEQTTLDEACATVLDLVNDQKVSDQGGGRRRFEAGAADLAAVESFAVLTRIKSDIAQDPQTSHLDIDVEMQGETVSLHGMVYCFPEAAALKRIALGVPAGIAVDVSGVQLGGQEYAPVFFQDPLVGPFPHLNREFWTPALTWAAWVFAFVSAAIVVLGLTPAASWVTRNRAPAGDSRLQSFAGVIVDSHCGLSYKKGAPPTVDCVRDCVNEGGAKYALSDGTHLYLLSDQQIGEQFAARRVVGAGSFDQRINALRIRSIQAATLTPNPILRETSPMFAGH